MDNAQKEQITLWGRASSCNVQKVLWALQVLSIPYEHVSLGGDCGGLTDPAYLAMNPNGRVPALKDGDPRSSSASSAAL